MKAKLDKLKYAFKVNQGIYIFLLGLALIAVIAGSFYVIILNKSDQALVLETLQSFFNNIENNQLNYLIALKNALLINIGFVIIVWLLGLSVIGIPIILLLFFSKLFIIGFSLTSIIINYKLKGIFLSIVYIFPHHIINMFAYIFLIIYAIVISITITETIVKKKVIDFKPIMNKYIYVFLVTLIFVLISVLLEVLLSPILLKMILKA